MAERYWRKKVLLAKQETTYGTDPTPDGSNAILAHDIRLTPLAGDQVERTHDRPFFGARPQILTNTHVGLSFGVEIAGAGAAGDVPAYGALLRAAGLAETIDAGVDVQYDPVSDALESAALYLNMDGVLHPMLGYRANLSLTIRPSQLPVFAFEGRGLFVEPTDTAAVTPDYSGFEIPDEVSDANTDFSYGGSTLVLEELTLNFNNQVPGIFRVGEERIGLTDRGLSFSMLVRADTLATFDPYDLATSRTQSALQLVQGTVAGNIVQIDAPRCEIGRPEYAESQGDVMYRIPGRCLPSDSGNDEIKITVK
jgi:hypothetical protein